MKEWQFDLKKDLIFFDIESTGLNVLKDRIIQIALMKFSKDIPGPQEKNYLLNPGVPISPEAFAVHGISVDMVRNKPAFKDIADELFEWIGDADLAGYNSDRFDIPMLLEEFGRVGKKLDMKDRRTVDVQKIFYKMEPRTLKAAYKKYCGGDLDDAHDALADVRATAEVLQGQLEAYRDVDYVDGDGFVTKSPIQNDIRALAEFTSDSDSIDATNRLKYDSRGEVIFNFGKHIGRSVEEVFRQDRQYYHWMMKKDFSVQVKDTIDKIMKEKILK